MKAMDFKNMFYLIGLTSSYAYDDLSFQKVASQSDTWFQPYFNASYALDRNTTTCSRTYDIGFNSPRNTVWWKVDLGGVYSIYSINILFKNYDYYENRQRGRFAGFSLYVTNTDVSNPADIMSFTQCYKDGPQLPPLNFTTTCIEYGRYVIFYNERLNGVVYPSTYEVNNVYTDLCEVIVQGCNESGLYGSNCDTPCPIYCKYNTCHIENGSCFGCQPGWIGTSCNIACMESWYGVNCSQKCTGHCRDGTLCNHVTGQCERGCATGWTGTLCDTECDDGTYGYDCVNSCSGNCLNDSPCNKQTGQCERGCNPGYTNSDCSKECSSGYFGLGCNKRCIGHCIKNEACDHVSGFCLRGCMDGYIGRHCNISCKPGYYGTNCSFPCSPNCKTCRHTDGLCSCKAGWMGHSCSTECTQSYGEHCQYPCSEHCVNHTCDRFNGNCLCYGSLRNVETTDVPSSTFWIVAFSISLVINIILTSATFISRRKTFLKQKSNTDKINFSWRSGSNTEQTGSTDDPSHYQELNLSQTENTYQTLHQQ